MAEDVRITTRYREDDFAQALMGTSTRPATPATSSACRATCSASRSAEARSMAIHESQSLSFEMQLGRSRPLPRR